MENSRNLFSTGKNQNTKQNIDNRRLNLTTFEVRGEIPLAYSTGVSFFIFLKDSFFSFSPMNFVNALCLFYH